MKKLEIIKPGTRVWIKSDAPFSVEVHSVHIVTRDFEKNWVILSFVFDNVLQLSFSYLYHIL